MKSLKSLAAAFIAGALFYAAVPASAVPVLHEFSLNDDMGNPVHTGTFVIDDSLLIANDFIAFNELLSLSITTGLRTYTLANADEPATDGVMTNAMGEITGFVDSVGLTVTFVSLGSPNIFLTIDEMAPSGWSEFSISPFKIFDAGDSVTIRLPEPGALALFGLGLLGLGLARRRKAA